MGPAPVTGLVKSLQGRWSRNQNQLFTCVHMETSFLCRFQKVCYLRVGNWELSLSAATDAVSLILGVKKGANLVKF